MKIPARIGYLEDRPTWRVLSLDGRFRFALASQFLERLSGWALTIALVVLAYGLTERLSVVAGLMVLLVVPRLAAPAFAGLLARGDACRRASRLSFARGPLILSLVLVDSTSDLYWAAAVVAVLGVLGASLDELHGAALPRLTPHSLLPALNALLGRLEQLAMILAAMLVAGVLAASDIRSTFAIAVLACFGSWLLLTVDRREWQITPSRQAKAPGHRTGWFDSLSRIRLLLGAVFVGAIIGMGVRIALIEVIVGELDVTSVAYALLLGIVGLGAVAGPPLPVPRLLGRVPLSALIPLILMFLAIAAATIAWADSLLLIAVALFVCGVLAVTVDLVVTTAARHVIPGSEVAAAMGLLAGAVVVGQILSLALVAGASHIWNVTVVLSSMSAIAVLAGAVLLFVARGGAHLASYETR